MSIETLDKPKINDGSDTDSPDVAHYVKKDQIAESACTGKHLVALCGEVFPATKDTKGKPVCQECKRVYDQMKKD